MTKHTPGPWKADRQHNFFSICAGDEDAPNLIAETLDDTPLDEANARLIAEAPALLLCLSQIIAALPVSRDWLDPDLERNAKAAIRKAEGVSQEPLRRIRLP